jgi:hypothetical protein
VVKKAFLSVFSSVLCASSLGVLLFTGCATHAATSGRVVIGNEHAHVDVRFSDHDRRVIEEYYKKDKKRKGLPPGLAKRGGDLPPGLAKRERLPPGLEYDPLPAELEARLSPLPSGYLRVRVGRDIVLMDARTHVIFDVLYSAAY